MRNIFAGQLAHAAQLLLLIACVLVATRLPGFFDGELAGLSTRAWFWLVIANAIAHQVYVWFCWRVELHTQGLTRVFGSVAFTLYAALFTILILARPALVTALSMANAGTLPLDENLARPLAILLCVPVAWLGYSVRRYFGFARAFGIDHFDPAWRDRPMVRDAIFRFTPNAMYVFGFLLLWIPALYFRSTAGVVAAAFSHAYIWVHYLTTEQPDMETLYR